MGQATLASVQAATVALGKRLKCWHPQYGVTASAAAAAAAAREAAGVH